MCGDNRRAIIESLDDVARLAVIGGLLLGCVFLIGRCSIEDNKISLNREETQRQTRVAFLRALELSSPDTKKAYANCISAGGKSFFCEEIIK